MFWKTETLGDHPRVHRPRGSKATHAVRRGIPSFRTSPSCVRALTAALEAQPRHQGTRFQAPEAKESLVTRHCEGRGRVATALPGACGVLPRRERARGSDRCTTWTAEGPGAPGGLWTGAAGATQTMKTGPCWCENEQARGGGGHSRDEATSETGHAAGGAGNVRRLEHGPCGDASEGAPRLTRVPAVPATETRSRQSRAVSEESTDPPGSEQLLRCGHG